MLMATCCIYALNMYVTDRVNAVVLTPSSIKVTWNVIYNSKFQDCITGYNISYFTQASYTNGGSIYVDDVSHTYHILKNLEEYTEYEITLQVISNTGVVHSSNNVTVTTYSDSK